MSVYNQNIDRIQCVRFVAVTERADASIAAMVVTAKETILMVLR